VLTSATWEKFFGMRMSADGYECTRTRSVRALQSTGTSTRRSHLLTSSPPRTPSSVLIHLVAPPHSSTHDSGIMAAPAAERRNRLSWVSMPIELAVDIFARLDPASLSHCSAVCRSWKYILEDDRFWRQLFRRDANKWKVYGNTVANTSALIRRSSLSLWQKIFGTRQRRASEACTETFKAKYVQQFFINRAEDPHQGVLRLEQVIGQRPVPRSAIHYVPMFGYLSKKLLYKMMWLSQSPFSVQGRKRQGFRPREGCSLCLLSCVPRLRSFSVSLDVDGISISLLSSLFSSWWCQAYCSVATSQRST
jgi:F-box-like